MTQAPSIDIWTVALCSGALGYGGWAQVTTAGGVVKGAAGGERRTTRERMEVAALLSALQSVTDVTAPAPVRIHCDSDYVIETIKANVGDWRANGWRSDGAGPAENRDLWEKAAGLFRKRTGPISIVRTKSAPGGADQLGFVTAWATFAQDKVKGVPAFTAQIPKSNLKNFPLAVG